MHKSIKFIYTILAVTIVGTVFSFWIFKHYESKIKESTFKQSINNKNIQSLLIFQINEIDKTKDDTDNLIKNKVLIQDKKEIKNPPYEPGLKTIYEDKNGGTFKYVKEIGGEDSALTFNFYYNKNNKLIFTLITGAAYNGLDEESRPITSELEHKIYFSEKGDKIKELHAITMGPGYPWPEVWPENEIILNPLEDFNNIN